MRPGGYQIGVRTACPRCGDVIIKWVESPPEDDGPAMVLRLRDVTISVNRDVQLHAKDAHGRETEVTI